MALKSTKSEYELKGMQAAKMEDSVRTATSDFSSISRILCLYSSYRAKSKSNFKCGYRMSSWTRGKTGSNYSRENTKRAQKLW
jgi:hypothetical protein